MIKKLWRKLFGINHFEIGEKVYIWMKPENEYKILSLGKGSIFLSTEECALVEDLNSGEKSFCRVDFLFKVHD